MKKTATLAAALVSMLAGAAGGQQLGTVSGVHVGPEHCTEAPQLLSQPYTCVELTVSCPQTLPRSVNLRVTEPPPDVTVRGTVVFGMGGAGRGWYESARPDPTGTVATHAADMLDRLNLAGFRVIQRSWGDDPVNPGLGGWFNGSESLHDSACRYATLLAWIHGKPALHDPSSEAFCATGNSGGSSEISYALSVYSLGNRLDLAMPTAGPPHGVVHRGCDLGSQPWEQECNQLVESLGICPQLGPSNHVCFYSANAISLNDSAFDLNPPPDDMPCANQQLGVLRDNSVLFPSARLSYPDTKVHFIYGVDDCGSAPPLGIPYLQAVAASSAGPVSWEVVADTGHTVPASLPGTLAVEAAITAAGGCVLRHLPGGG